MKKIFTLLAAALVTITSFAAARPTGKITINDMSKRQLIIEVDGRRYSDNNRGIVIDKLEPGNHSIQIFSQQRYSDWRGIFDRNGRKQVIYNSTLYVKPRTHVMIFIDRNGRVQVEEAKMRSGGRWDDNSWENRDNRDYDYDRDYRFDPTRSAMDAQSFEMLKRALGRENFEKTRLEIVKQTIDRNNFNSSQVRELALLFAFEENKLDLAKYAYGHTIDKNNYFQLYNVFSFSSSKEELSDYIRRFR